MLFSVCATRGSPFQTLMQTLFFLSFFRALLTFVLRGAFHWVREREVDRLFNASSGGHLGHLGIHFGRGLGAGGGVLL